MKSIVRYSDAFVVNIEPTNACNLRCVHCGDDKKRKIGFITPELFEKVSIQCRGKEIRPFMSGEPLMHKGIFDLIKIATKYSSRVVLHTNATLLDEKKANALVESGIQFVSISFDGLTKEEYEGNRKGANFESVSENISRFLKINNKKVHVTVQRIIKKGEPAIGVEKLFDGANVYSVIVRHSWDVRGRVEGCKSHTNYDRYCFFPWNYIPVLWNGDVCLCCADLNGKCIIGDINKDSLEKIWNGPQMVSIRDRMIRGIPIPEICSGCERYNP
ncbi:MAG: SPASM domain-containing protein [Nitrospirae bacterium]|nr:SPASM domain-containing protein [Nitrospirota bacterium]